MKIILLLISLIVCSMKSTSQNNKVSPSGEYYLEGVRETASGILLKPDSTFEFFYSYGAVDRTGKGKWSAREGFIVLNSSKQPEKDFALINSKKNDEKNIIVKVIDPNKMLLSFIQGLIQSREGNVIEKSDNEGVIRFQKLPIDSISLVFTLCGERPTTFRDINKEHNYFEFRFEPWICEVFFNNLEFKVDNEGLIGGHPLLNGKEFRYRKAGQ